LVFVARCVVGMLRGVYGTVAWCGALVLVVRNIWLDVLAT